MNTAFHVVVLYARLYYMHDYLLVLVLLLVSLYAWLVLVLVISFVISVSH